MVKVSLHRGNFLKLEQKEMSLFQTNYSQSEPRPSHSVWFEVTERSDLHPPVQPRPDGCLISVSNGDVSETRRTLLLFLMSQIGCESSQITVRCFILQDVDITLVSLRPASSLQVPNIICSIDFSIIHTTTLF